MKKLVLNLVLCIGLISTAYAESNPKVRMETNQGVIVLELNAEKAPLSVENFIAYVQEGYYEGMIFHRVIKDFMIQGGGFDTDFNKKQSRAPIKNEAKNGLSNKKGTIAMARTNAPHSASSQFFINTVDNDFLDHSAPTPRGWGYAVFGHVVEGMDVVDKIRQIPTQAKGPFPTDVPEETVIIESVTLVEE